jgi:hypothetical protein
MRDVPGHCPLVTVQNAGQLECKKVEAEPVRQESQSRWSVRTSSSPEAYEQGPG